MYSEMVKSGNSNFETMKVKTSIIRIETTINFTLWICSISYAIYETYQVGNRFFSYNFDDKYNDFSHDWKWLERKKDNSDPEWKYGTQLLKEIVPWYMVHIIIAEILRQCNRKNYLKIWYIFIGISFCVYHLGWKVTIYFLFQPIVGYVLVQFKSKTVIWLCNLGSLVVINYYDFFQLDFSHLSDYKQHISISAIAWINLRSLNYFLDAAVNSKLQKYNIENVLTVCAYCFYLPIMFYGPLILFTDFNTIFEQTNVPIVKERCRKLFTNLLRFIFWLIFTELVLHYVYVNALSYQSEVISHMNLWALYGQGYCMGQFFHIKYLVFYGISTTIAQFEGIIVPTTPKCIGRIHLYSDMWKYFDRGLYLFLLRYIYIPISSAKKTLTTKLFASLMCFLYVYVWHGTQVFIAVWSLLNFIGITVETLCKEISKTTLYQNVIINNMSTQMHRRLTCVLATPLFAMSALSNFYFFAGKQVGDIYVSRFVQGQFSSQCMILTVLYFGSQVSVEIKHWEHTYQKQANVK